MVGADSVTNIGIAADNFDDDICLHPLRIISARVRSIVVVNVGGRPVSGREPVALTELIKSKSPIILPGAVSHPRSLRRSRVDLCGETGLARGSQASVQTMAVNDQGQNQDRVGDRVSYDGAQNQYLFLA